MAGRMLHERKAAPPAANPITARPKNCCRSRWLFHQMKEEKEGLESVQRLIHKSIDEGMKLSDPHPV